MRHWAASLIGRAWSPQRSCWELVRHVYATRYGIKLPMVVIGSNDNLAALKQTIRIAGLKQVDEAPGEGDIIVMRSTTGLHAGVVIAVDGKLRLLHSTRATGVVCERISEATEGTEHALWKRSSELPPVQG